MPQDKNHYWENIDRCIYVTGEIDQTTVDKLTPTINRLRIESPGAITAYIDSEGGRIDSADQIRNLLKAPNQNNVVCNLTTVVTGSAASAAADFLALGDYSIAYPNSTIIYHGSRQQSRSALTYESATSLASSLQQINERFARRLAQRIFKRFVLRIAQFEKEFKAYRNSDLDKTPDYIDELINVLKMNFGGNERLLIHDALKKQRDISSLSSAVSQKLARLKTDRYTDSQFEAAFLKAIVDFKVKTHYTDAWLISQKGLGEISDDFNLLHDYHYGSQNRDLNIQIETFGELFLKDEWAGEYKSLTVSENEKMEWLKQHALPKMQPVWYFIISLCRLLQTSDYIFESQEAYWIGLVDEVPGSNLPNLREAAEVAKSFA